MEHNALSTIITVSLRNKQILRHCKEKYFSQDHMMWCVCQYEKATIRSTQGQWELGVAWCISDHIAKQLLECGCWIVLTCAHVIKV